MTELSIIIPVYNAEKYLESCLRSVLACPRDGLEVILSDDGSTDGSGALCDDWAGRDPRVRVFHRKNEGVSAARNYGIGDAQGTYTMFLDADDFLIERWWEPVWDQMDSGSAFIGFSYYSLDQDGSSREEPFPGEAKIRDPGEISRILLATPLLHPCWGKLFVTEVLKTKKVEFPVDRKIGEDYLFVLRYFSCISLSDSCLVNTPVLYYRQNQEGAMGNFRYGERVKSMEVLRNACRAYMEEKGIHGLEDAVAVYYFRGLTKLMRDASGAGNFGICKEIFRNLKREPVVEEILRSVSPDALPLYKRAEYRLIRRAPVGILAVYFMWKKNMKKR